MKRAVLACLLALACGEARAQYLGEEAGIHGNLGAGAAADPTPVFDFFPGDSDDEGSGVHRLTADVFAATTVIECDAKDDTATDWPCTTGGTFTESDALGNTTIGFAAPFTRGESRSTWFDRLAGKRAPNTTVGEVGSGVDVSLIVIAHAKAISALQNIAGKHDFTNSEGYGIRVSAANSAHGIVNGTTVGAYTLDTFGEWNIYELQCDSGATNGARFYVNGALAGSAANCPSTLANTTSAKNFSFGCRPNGSQNDCLDGFIAYGRVQTCTGCMTTTADQDAVAARHAYEIMGIWPAHAVVAPPTLVDRTGPAYLDLIRHGDLDLFSGSVLRPARVRHFRVGSNWMRVSRRREGGGDGVTAMYGRAITGFLSEGPIDGSATNTQLLVQTHNYGTTWTDITAADAVTATSIRALNDSDDEVWWVEAATDAVGVEHGVRQAVTLEASVSYIFSVMAGWTTDGANATDWLYLRDATTANAFAFFDVEHCQIGTRGAGLHDMGGAHGGTRASAWVQDLGSYGAGSYRWCRMSIVVDGTAASHNFDIGSATADNDTTHTTSSGQRVLLLWGSQLEETTSLVGQVHPTSYIPRAAAAATRDSDNFDFNVSSNWPAAGGTIQVEMLYPDARIQVGQESSATGRQQSNTPCNVEKNGTNYIQIEQTGDPGLNGTSFSIMTAGAQQIGTIALDGVQNMRDGQLSWMRAVALPNNAYAVANGDPDLAQTPDTSVTLPTFDSGQISIGYSHAFNVQWTHGLIHRCAIYAGTDYEAPNP